MAGVDVDDGEGDLPEEGFFAEPDGRGGVLPGAPEDSEVLELGFGFADDGDALLFQVLEVFIHE